MQRLKCFFSVHVGNDEKMSEYTRLESREAGHEGIKMEAREHYHVIEGRGPGTVWGKMQTQKTAAKEHGTLDQANPGESKPACSQPPSCSSVVLELSHQTSYI